MHRHGFERSGQWRKISREPCQCQNCRCLGSSDVGIPLIFVKSAHVNIDYIGIGRALYNIIANNQLRPPLLALINCNASMGE